MNVSASFIFILIISQFLNSQSMVTITFPDPSSGDGYTVSDNTITITGSGPFELTGSEEDKSIIVSSSCTINLNDFSLINNEELTPLIINENTAVELVLGGDSTLQDSVTNENDGTIYLKNGASLTISGDGILNIIPNKYMAINGTDDTSLTVNGGEIQISSEANTVGGIYLKKEINFNEATFFYSCENGAHHAIDSEGPIKLLKGEYSIYSGNGKGIQSEKNLQIGLENGEINDISLKIITSNEGIEAMGITINSGSVEINSGGDGINAASSGNECDESIQCSGDCVCYININEGLLNIISGKDGLDSNGDITIKGGKIIIFAASKGEDQPIDQDGLLSIEGGAIIAAGSSSISGVKAQTTQIEKKYTGKINKEIHLVVKENDVEIFDEITPKEANYIYFNFESAFTAELGGNKIKLLNLDEEDGNNNNFGNFLFLSNLIVLFCLMLIWINFF